MNTEKIIVIIIAIIILLIGIIGGFSNSKNNNLRFFHNAISIIFILIIILGIPVHFQRLIDKSSYNFITWLHFIIFSFILYISIKAIKRWNFKKNNYETFNSKNENFENNKDAFIVTYNNNKYDIKDFIPNHPGGSIINNSKNKDLEKVWELYNVSWHKTNSNVQNKLNQYKI